MAMSLSIMLSVADPVWATSISDLEKQKQELEEKKREADAKKKEEQQELDPASFSSTTPAVCHTETSIES